MDLDKFYNTTGSVKNAIDRLADFYLSNPGRLGSKVLEEIEAMMVSINVIEDVVNEAEKDWVSGQDEQEMPYAL